MDEEGHIVGTRPADRRPPLRVEDLILSLLCTAAGPLLWWFGTTALAGAPAGGGLQFVERSVASLCAGAGAIIALWWVVAVLGTALAAVGSRWRSVPLARIGRGLSPAFLRRVAASVLGVNVLLAPGAWAAEAVPAGFKQPRPSVDLTVPAPSGPSVVPDPGWLPAPGVSGSGPALTTAVQSAEDDASSTGSLAAVRLDAPVDDDLPTPTWTPGTPAPAAPDSTRPARPSAVDASTVSVRHGDCLWDIAAHELGPTATDLEIDRRWRQWHEHNRAIIGAEADLLLPGTVLTAPPFD